MKSRLSIGMQAGLLRNLYPGSIVSTKYDAELRWRYLMKPSPFSDNYEVEVRYRIGLAPQTYVLSPLALASNETKLPHVYSQEEQRLCLYFPDGQEWNSSMAIAKTIVPWTYEWLYHYELWLGTGDWSGGGIHLPSKKPKTKAKKKKT